MCEYQIINESDNAYPVRLKQMTLFYDEILSKEFTKPSTIYVCGNALESLNSEVAISIIGTRSPFYKAFEIAELVGRIAGGLGITIVSGFATGIDYSGHLGATDSLAKTIAILGSGINKKLPEKPGLMRYIKENGIFISELDNPDSPRTYDALMARDRLTAALSDAIFVIETDPKGGAVHTAKLGKKFNRKVYTIDWDNSKYANKHQEGNSKLIQEEIAEAIPILDGEEQFILKITDILKNIK